METGLGRHVWEKGRDAESDGSGGGGFREKKTEASKNGKRNTK